MKKESNFDLNSQTSKIFKSMKKTIASGILVLGLWAVSCSDPTSSEKPYESPQLPSEPYSYSQLKLPMGLFNNQNILPDIGFPGPDILVPIHGNPVSVVVTDHGATLGRVLFYDKALSLNNSVSCGSCHHQDKAFADGKQFSPGFQGKITDRNSMGFANPITQRNLFWDSRSFSLTDLSLRPVQNHIEMGMENLLSLEKKLAEIPYYPELFEKAFGSKEITAQRISDAISQFVGAITTADSKFDVAIARDAAGADDNGLNDLEKLGRTIFFSNKAKCSSCHGGNNFAALDGPFDPYGGGSSGSEDLKGTTNIGLEVIYKDNGRQNGSFRIPSLRNIALTGPYMHDGRFKSLMEVINHYDHGIKPHANLDPKFRNPDGSVVRLGLTHLEKTALVAFLETLTDSKMTSDPKYSNPFQN